MTTPSHARLLLEHWGIGVADIPTSDKEESDFLATFGPAKVLIEEKTKLDDAAYLAQRAKVLDSGEIQSAPLPLVRDKRLHGIVSKAAGQLKPSASQPSSTEPGRPMSRERASPRSCALTLCRPSTWP